MGQVNYQEELDNLKTEASRVVSDISHLTSSMNDLGKTTGKDVSDKMNRKVEAELKTLRERLESIEAKVRIYTQRIDGHVRSNPYLYILGSLGVGALLGKLLTPRTR